MKDTKDNEKQEHNEKVNFQSLRQCVFDDNCCINYRKCDFNLLYDELVRIW